MLSNTNSIIINDSTTPPTLSSPYPSAISVTGVSGQVVTKVTVTLHGLGHAFPEDIDMLLVGPHGDMTFLMSNVGGDARYSVTNLEITLDDGAASALPLNTPLVSGTFKPAKRYASLPIDLPPAAPPGNSNAVAALSVFNGTDPTGSWNLFVVDDTSPDAGVISGGWSLAITTIPVVLDITPEGPNVVLSWTNALTGFTLQTTSSLESPVVWTNALPTPAVDAGQYTVTNAATGDARYYRLAK